MPNWKKLITSGSAASLSSITTSGDITIPATNKIYLDGGVDTYISEASADTAEWYVGGTRLLQLAEGATNYVAVGDGTYLGIGNDIDLNLSHNGTSSTIQNGTGDLYIQNTADDRDIIFRTDDGSGGVTPYLTLDGSGGYMVVSKFMIFTDGQKAEFGSSEDLQIYHNGGGNSNIDNLTGDLYVTQYKDDGDIILRSDDGSGGVTPYITLDGSAGFTTVQKLMRFDDDVHARFGTSSDLRIFHNGTNSRIDNYTGTLQIRNTLDDADITLETDDGSGGVTPYITLDGSAGTVEIAKTTNVDGTLTSTGDVVAYYSSDERLKDNIIRIENPLEKIEKIGGYTFDWNDKQETYTGKDVGVIAQEIQEVLPELVTERDNGYLAVKYEKIVPLLIESIKELKQEVDEIKQKCDCLNN